MPRMTSGIGNAATYPSVSVSVTVPAACPARYRADRSGPCTGPCSPSSGSRCCVRSTCRGTAPPRPPSVLVLERTAEDDVGVTLCVLFEHPLGISGGDSSVYSVFSQSYSSATASRPSLWAQDQPRSPTSELYTQAAVTESVPDPPSLPVVVPSAAPPSAVSVAASPSPPSSPPLQPASPVIPAAPSAVSSSRLDLACFLSTIHYPDSHCRNNHLNCPVRAAFSTLLSIYVPQNQIYHTYMVIICSICLSYWLSRQTGWTSTTDANT